jgi:hypothetical protein
MTSAVAVPVGLLPHLRRARDHVDLQFLFMCGVLDPGVTGGAGVLSI